MPYTPPSLQSPASSTPVSPAISRNSSYSDESGRSPMMGKSQGRPHLPRSMSSASYLHKHRRSPSISKPDSAPPTQMKAPDPIVHATDFAPSSSLRQSPPPLNNLVIPTGAVISPPESLEGSDGDENTNDPRGREWEQLKEAVRAIDQKREGSPAKDDPLTKKSLPESAPQPAALAALSAEARKISHSRSSTETALVIPRTTSFVESPTQASEDSDEEEDLHFKPILVRKKSGELVKPALRPSSRRRYSSMPGTPTYSKSVHFNDSDNQTRHFLQVDKPIAVSASTSPVDTYDSETEFPFDPTATAAKSERDIKLANFPEDSFARKTKPIHVERIHLSPDKQTLIGTCVAQNIAFHKLVVARFTLDYWKTTSEVVAEYRKDPKLPKVPGCDRFNFHINLSDQTNIDQKTLLLCVRYNVGGHEFWDNNANANYRIDFINTEKKAAKPSTAVNGLGARPLNAIPRSRHSPPATSRARQESVDDDFTSSFDNSSTYHFGSSEKLLNDTPPVIKLKPRSNRGSLFPAGSGSPSANGLGGRYDFGASLSAALSTAQDKLGRQSGLMSAAVPMPSRESYFASMERKDGPVKTDERPDLLTTDRPAIGSDQYRDLVEKFCYFTSGAGKLPSPLPSRDTPPNHYSFTPIVAKTDGANEDKTYSPSASGVSTPSPLLDGNNEHTPIVISPFISRSASPAPVTGHGLGNRASTPISFGYPYLTNTRDGYLSDSYAPTAIRG